MRTALSLVLIMCSGLAWAAEPPLNYAAPHELPGVSREMRNAAFWIVRHPSPDKLVLLPNEVTRFNDKTRADGLIANLTSVPELQEGRDIRFRIEKLASLLRGKKLYLSDGSKAGVAFYVPIFSAAMSGLHGTRPLAYGIMAATADERILPTETPLYASPGDVHFDQLQNSGISVGVPVLILHATPDGEWLFIKDEAAEGWVRSDKVARCNRGDFLKYYARLKDTPGVVLAARSALYADERMTIMVSPIRMGAVFALKGSGTKAIEITLPRRGLDGNVRFASGFIAREDLGIGFLPFTARNILNQAFKVLDHPYGWGDMQGGQDCSSLMQMVFATVGIKLPRNSGEQAQVGYPLGAFDARVTPDQKKAVLHNKAVGGLALLRLKGHIMLYLGEIQARPFAIHSVWAYREKTPDGERARLIGRVAVTDLDLGSTGTKGSLLKRIVDVRAIKAEEAGIH